MIRALIIGATGLVGNSLYRRWRGRPGWELLGTAATRPLPPLEPLDIRDPRAVRAILERFKPGVTVLSASNPHVDYCETHPAETRVLNVTATIAAAEAAREAGSLCVFFSSDYVFDGKSGPYAEEDPVAPLSEYARQKVEVEDALRRGVREHLIARISGVYGWELSRKNFVLQVLDRAAAGRPVQAAADISYNPTYAPDIAAVLAELIEAGARGTFHVAGSLELTRHAFALEIASVFGLKGADIEAVALAALKAPAARPMRSSLDTGRLRSLAASPMSSARQGLELMRAATEDWKAYAARFALGN